MFACALISFSSKRPAESAQGIGAGCQEERPAPSHLYYADWGAGADPAALLYVVYILARPWAVSRSLLLPFVTASIVPLLARCFSVRTLVCTRACLILHAALTSTPSRQTNATTFSRARSTPRKEPGAYGYYTLVPTSSERDVGDSFWGGADSDTGSVASSPVRPDFAETVRYFFSVSFCVSGSLSGRARKEKPFIRAMSRVNVRNRGSVDRFCVSLGAVEGKSLEE